jgi:hypothetical protein
MATEPTVSPKGRGDVMIDLMDELDDDLLDHPDDLLGDTDPLSEEEGELFPLFAEALDPNNPKTIEEAKAEWEQVLQ